MKRIAQIICASILVLLALCGCEGNHAPAETVVIVTPTPELSASAVTENVDATPDVVESPLPGPEGMTALEFAENYPEIECDTVQLGVITEITDKSVTFNKAIWLYGDELPKDYSADYCVQETGETAIFELRNDCQFWILWHAHWINPARICLTDFVRYCDESSWPVYWFYSIGDHLLMVTEQ